MKLIFAFFVVTLLAVFFVLPANAQDETENTITVDGVVLDAQIDYLACTSEEFGLDLTWVRSTSSAPLLTDVYAFGWYVSISIDAVIWEDEMTPEYLHRLYGERTSIPMMQLLPMSSEYLEGYFYVLNNGEILSSMYCG